MTVFYIAVYIFYTVICLKIGEYINENQEKLCSTVVASMTVFLLLILISSVTSASTIQDSPSNGPYAYITSCSNTVYVIDTANNTVTATVHVGTYTYPEGVTHRNRIGYNPFLPSVFNKLN